MRLCASNVIRPQEKAILYWLGGRVPSCFPFAPRSTYLGTIVKFGSSHATADYPDQMNEGRGPRMRMATA